jgi:hypothetical protein
MDYNKPLHRSSNGLGPWSAAPNNNSSVTLGLNGAMHTGKIGLFLSL